MIPALQAAQSAGALASGGFDSLLKTPESSAAGSSPFANLLKDAVGRTSQLEDQARTAIDGLMTGTGVDVHQAMIASEKASMAFELALAVRNKAVQSYQSIMSMQF
jgi:flagellar hook-basal body complex protein FliE